MEKLKFSEVCQLLNACRLAELSERPKKLKKGRWELYEGHYKAHVFSYSFSLLYFFSDVRKEDLLTAKREAFKSGETMVVYAPSSSIVDSIKDMFERDARGLWSTPEYLRSFMLTELSEYRNKLAGDRPKDYIEPRFIVPAGFSRRTPNPIESFMKDPVYSSENATDGSLAVVLAEAGHGKTYMCQWLVARLAGNEGAGLPIYVNSTQWKLLQHDDLQSIARTLTSSFRALGAPIPWMEGQEELFLSVALKAGLFKIVFDGFDEYVLQNPGGIDAKEVLLSLTELAHKTGTKIVITSRSSFWDAEIGNQPDQDSEGRNTYDLYKIESFDASQAKNYFRIKFGNDENKIALASEIFSELNRDDPTFAGRGFVLLLISDLVNSGHTGGSQRFQEKPLFRLIRAHSDRENIRHNLAISSEQQITALEQFAFEITQGEPNTTETMLYALKTADPQLNDDVALTTLEKMAPHALIVREGSAWKIRQPQVRIAFLANKILSLVDTPSDFNLLRSFSNKAKLEVGEESDLAAMIYSVASWSMTHSDAITKIQGVIKCFFENSDADIEHIRNQLLRRLSTLIALYSLENNKELKTSKDRSEAFRAFFPKNNYSGVILLGGINRFDFSGHEFFGCVFDNVKWANCRFDETTSFSNTLILGGTVTYCTGFHDIRLKNIQADEPGRTMLNNEAVRAGRKKYSDENLKNDIRYVLEQFIGKGGVGFKSVDQSLYGRGKISASPHKDRILTEIRRFILDEHHISASSKKGLAIREDARESVKAFIANNILTDKLIELHEAIQSKLT